MGFRMEKKKKFEMDELNNASILNFQSFPFLEVNFLEEKKSNTKY